MPRVYTKTAVTRRYSMKEIEAGKFPEGIDPMFETKPAWRCDSRGCDIGDGKIYPGQKYHTWSFRYGGTRRIHAEHGFPKPSMLTQSKMSEVYAAIEEAEENIGNIDDYTDLENALSEVVEVANQVADEYEEAAEAFGGQGENQDRADDLHGWADEVENALSSVSDEFSPCGENDDEDHDENNCLDCDDNRETWLADIRGAATDVLGTCPL